MSTPNDERPEPTYGYNGDNPRVSAEARTGRDRSGTLPSYNVNHENRRPSHERSSDEEGTVVGESEGLLNKGNGNGEALKRDHSHLTVETEYDPGDPLRGQFSPSQTREQSHRLDDDLAMLKIERQVSRRAEEDAASKQNGGEDGEPLYRSRSRKRDEHVDDFDIATNPVHEKTQVYKPIENPSSGFGKFVRALHKSNWAVRYFTYIAPLALILLIPLLVGALKYRDLQVGGVVMYWFMIWLEIVWLTLWLGRIIAKCLPWPIGLVSGLFTNNSKKWRDMGKQLELPATLFFWWLAIEISFLPTMTHHQVNRPSGETASWMKTMNKVLVSVFVLAILNFIEKIIIQLIAISFHLRTYADRIELNKFQIGSLAKLYKFSKEKIAMEDSEFEGPSEGPGSGTRTPGAVLGEAAKQTKEAFNKFGDIAGKVAGDFTGKAVTKSTHPNQVVIALLSSTGGSQVLARRLYRTFAQEDTETVHSDNLKNAFENDDEATAAFSMFDKDMNGDISMEELEAVCVEIGRERKSITASLKDLDSVVGKLDDILMFIVAIVVILVFISLISTSAAGVLTSAGSAVLALSWLFSATAQEFLQSIIFVFVKHPFDVGDRVGVYGNTGAAGLGDDYFVKEISLLYTEFKKMEGHVVQAPNSYLNGLFILNQRRSGGLAEAVPVTIKFGTTLEQIDGLRTKLLEFVKSEKREYQANLLTELREVKDVHSMTLNVVFFYKSNWQNEGLRLARRNKFICALMVTMGELGIEGPYMRFPGMKQSFPMYLQSIPHIADPHMGHTGHPDNPGGFYPDEGQEGTGQDPPFVTPAGEDTLGSLPPGGSRMRSGSILRSQNLRGGRQRSESLAAMNKRVDFSLGARGYATNDPFSGDVFEDRQRERIPISVTEASRSRERSAATALANERRSAEAARRSNDLARTTSRDTNHLGHGLMRRSTESAGRSSSHRNRFFGRAPRSAHADEAGLMETGMADIPENPSTAGSGANSAHLDPRTGTVGPTAWRTQTDDSARPGPPRIPTDVVPNSMQQQQQQPYVEDDASEGHRAPGRSQTEDFEMRRFR